MEDLKKLNNIELKEVYGGEDIRILSGYPGQSLVNFVWSTLKAAYQQGYDEKLKNIEPCR